MHKVFPLFLVLAVGAAWGQDVGQLPEPEPAVYALQGVTVHVGDGRVVSGATVLVRDGLIADVGANVMVPAEARVLDFQGMHVYPGFIDALRFGGVKKADSSGQGEASEADGPGYFAHVSVADSLDSNSSLYDSWRNAGVLAAQMAPDEGIFRGRSALVNFNGLSPDEMIVRPDVAMGMSFQSQGFTEYPGSLMGVIAHIRQTLLDAKHYREAWQIYGAQPRGLRRPETDRTLSALGPVIEGRMPVILPASREREILRALALSEEASVRAIIVGAQEASRVTQQLKQSGAAVLVSLKFPEQEKDQPPDTVENVGEIRYRVDARRSASDLEKAGIKFAFSSDGASPRDFIAGIRTAVQLGLSKEGALRAATLSAAEILGAGQQLGSVESGKIANLTVSDKEIFEKDSTVKHVFVDGRHFEVSGSGDSSSGSEGGPRRRRPAALAAVDEWNPSGHEE